MVKLNGISGIKQYLAQEEGIFEIIEDRILWVKKSKKGNGLNDYIK